MSKTAKKSVSKRNEIVPELKTKSKFKELPFSKLRWTCPESEFKFKSTAEIKPLDKIVGQPRAIEAIKMGAELFSKGYNIFVSGLAGTGRLTTVQKILLNVTTRKPILWDFCYVNNFSEPDQPRLIRLPAGKGKEFSTSVDDAITFLQRRLPKLFEEEGFQKSRRKIIEEYQNREREVLENFDKRIKPFGFVRGQIENEQGVVQPEVFPMINGEAVQIDALEEILAEKKITEKDAKEFRKNYQKFHNEIYDIARQGIKIMQEFRKTIIENDKSAALNVVKSVFDEIRSYYISNQVDVFINEVIEYILENINMFVHDANPVPNLTVQSTNSNGKDQFSLFYVNVILDNSKTENAPIVVETTPSYNNLFGNIERVFDSRGFWRTDFTKIKAGSLLKADQGYLIVNADDLFNEPGVWNALKRVLLYDRLEIQPYDTIFNFSQSHLKPEKIKVRVKVIIIGGQTLYQWLYNYEKGFKKIFKVNAQFDYETFKDKTMLESHARFIAKICFEDDLPHCSPDGVAAIVEWAVCHGGSQDRITLKFSDVADVVRESAYYLNGTKKQLIGREDVKNAINARKYRHDLLDEKIRNHILIGDTLIDTSGERVGQINGLTVYDTGLLSFGKPARITANISVGNAGIINVEREVNMSGSIHNKGVLIISGFLREKFAKDNPLSLTASIAFEQNYGGIDGDSASAAEIFVLLSALTNIPIKQHLAVTGSVNQKGDIQPIGGVNEKITGFFEICRLRGLDGKHGVIIPDQNVKDLMLNDEIIDAVKIGQFHIYPMKTIDEGVEVMLGITAGKLGKNGKYPKGTLYYRVVEELSILHKCSKGSKKDKNKKTS